MGGLICSIGQFIRFMLEYAGLKGDVLAGAVSAILIFLGCLLTVLRVPINPARRCRYSSLSVMPGTSTWRIHISLPISER